MNPVSKLRSFSQEFCLKLFSTAIPPQFPAFSRIAVIILKHTIKHLILGLPGTCRENADRPRGTCAGDLTGWRQALNKLTDLYWSMIKAKNFLDFSNGENVKHIIWVEIRIIAPPRAVCTCSRFLIF